MKKLLNTLYVTTQGLYLHREGETVVAELKGKILLRLPVHTLSGIICFGNVLCSPFLLGLCGERGVSVSFLTEHGKFLSRVVGPISGNVLLRIAQMKASFDPTQCVEIAKSCIIGKILNTKTVLQRRMRDHGFDESCKTAVSMLSNILLRLKNANDLNQIRGLEGEAANEYFSVFNQLLCVQGKDFKIQGRSRRPPLDPMNALLSFLYTVLAHDCASACESVGLDPQIGYLHSPRSGRASLALDLMEELRSFLVDRTALSIVNLGQVSIRDFKISETGAVEMKDTCRKEVLLTWQKRKQESILHPFLEEKIPIGLIPYVQALLLARYLRGDIDAYPPFLSR